MADDDARIRTSVARLTALRAQARGFTLLPHQPVGGALAGSRASRLRGRGLSFDEIRRYLPGDDVRRMDWRVTARTRQPHVRIFTEERERPVLLVVDQRANLFFASGGSMKSVVAAEAAALAAWRVVASKDRVGGVVIGDDALTTVSPGRDRRTVLRLLGAIAERNRGLDAYARSRPGMLNEALRRVARLAPHDALVVLIGDGDGIDDESRRLAAGIARHNDVVALLVQDPLEAAWPAAGTLVASDGELQIQVPDSTAFRRRWADEAERRRATLARFLRSREIPVLALSTAEPVADQVRRALAHGRRR